MQPTEQSSTTTTREHPRSCLPTRDCFFFPSSFFLSGFPSFFLSFFLAFSLSDAGSVTYRGGFGGGSYLIRQLPCVASDLGAFAPGTLYLLRTRAPAPPPNPHPASASNLPLDLPSSSSSSPPPPTPLLAQLTYLHSHRLFIIITHLHPHPTRGG